MAFGLLTEPATRQNTSQAPTSKSTSVPPPVGGLNYRDDKSAMKPQFATLMDNLFPNATTADIRRGYASHATGMGSSNTIKTLMTWNGASSSKMKACVNGSIYDVTAAGAVGAAEVSGLSVNDWQWCNFTNSAGTTFLVACNGTDAVRNYDGSSWTSPSITGSGLTSANLIYVHPFKNRLWFVEKNSPNAWYLPTGAIAGTASKQNLGAQFSDGGSLIAIGTISSDAGDGADDKIAFVSSLGQIVVYQGTDPSSATTWQLVGIYSMGYPVGRRCLVKVGGDTGIITNTSIVSIKQAMTLDRAAAERGAITNLVQRLFNQYARDYGSNSGWMPIVYPKGKYLLINVAFSTTQYVQLIMNTTTGAWCRFTGMNGYCWGLLGENLYFGGTNGVVYKADTGYQDNAGVITADLREAWNYLDGTSRQKFVTFARPIIQTDGAPSILFNFNADFQEVDPTGSITASAPANSLWGTATWGSGVWGGESASITNWNNPQAVGYIFAPRLKITTNGAAFSLNTIDVQYQPGGPI